MLREDAQNSKTQSMVSLVFPSSERGRPKDQMGLGLGFFFCCLPDMQNCPLVCVLETHIYRQNIVWSSNMVPQLRFIFLYFDFLYFFVFF